MATGSRTVIPIIPDGGNQDVVSDSAGNIITIKTSALISRAKQGETTAKKDKQKNVDLAKILLAEHPLYKTMKPFWELYKDLYEGLKVKQFIHKHLRESQQSYRERKKRSYYLNYVEQVVNIYSGFLFNQPIIRKVEPSTTTTGGTSDVPDPGDAEEIDQIFNIINQDFDRTGRSVDDFMKEVAVWNLVKGTQHVLVDMPSADEVKGENGNSSIISFRDQKENRFLPFAVRINPEDVTNWSIDSSGSLLWIRIREANPPIEDALSEDVLKHSEGKQEEITRFKTWDRESWILHEVRKVKEQGKTFLEAKVLSKGDHGLGVVPLITIKSRSYSASDFMGISFVHDMAMVSIAILNVCSLLDEEMYQKALTLLVVKKSAEEKSEIVIGGNNTMEYSGDAAPQFLSPSLTPGEFFLDIIERLGKEIMRMAKLDTGTGEIKEALSGIAHAYLFNETNQALSEQSDSLERSEIQIYNLMLRWMDIPRDQMKVSIGYPDDFGLVDVTKEMLVLRDVKFNIRSNTLRAELQKNLAQVLLQGKSTDDELFKTINDEIEKRKNEKDPPPAPLFGGGFGGFGGGGGGAPTAAPVPETKETPVAEEEEERKRKEQSKETKRPKKKKRR